MKLTQPKNQTADILWRLIQYNGVSEQQTGFNGFRSRISDLKRKYKVNIRSAFKTFTNRFGRVSRHKVHFIRDGDKRKAGRVYEKINK